MKTVAVISAKGGVGKTSFATNLGIAFARAGRPVLVIDLDPQNAACHHYGVNPAASPGLALATLNAQNWRDAAIETASGVHVLPYGQPSENERIAFETVIAAQPGWLSNALQALQLPEQAIVIFDTPPGASVYTQRVLSMVDLALVVTLPDPASYAALSIMERLLDAYSRPRPDFRGARYVINQTNGAQNLARDITSIVRADFGQNIIAQVHLDQSMREALAQRQNIFDFSPYSQAAQDMRECTVRIEQLFSNGNRQP